MVDALDGIAGALNAGGADETVAAHARVYERETEGQASGVLVLRQLQG